ncbi:MAG: PKD domain-containing protein, partial [Candidatus Thermoplasmatota archaeon]
AHEKTVEIKWKTPMFSFYPLTLSLTANEYPRLSCPLQFNDGFYEIGSNIKKINVDGVLDENLVESLFKPFWKPDTGHPSGYTYIYISEDPENVYFSLDITCDNTNDVGGDWAEVIINGQTFRIDDFNTKWGKLGFGKTDKVGYKHQTAEFAIPKKQIESDKFDFDIRYYGTASQCGDEAEMIDQNGSNSHIMAGDQTYVQEVLILDGGNDNCETLIDSFNVTNQGTASDDQIASVSLWEDGGNGYFDGGARDDTQIGSTVNDPSLKTGIIIGGFNDKNPVLTISNGGQSTVYVAITLESTADEEDATIKTMLDGTDYGGSKWRDNGVETATSATKIFTIADFQSMHLSDGNSNGKIDEIYMNVSLPVGSADDIDHRIDESTTLQRFSITYDGNEVSVNSIQFVANYGDSAAFKLSLDENDEDLLFDTSTLNFEVTYDGSHGDLKIRLGTNHADVEGISEFWPETDRAKPIANLSVDTNPVYENDLDFNVTVNYSEEMDTNVIPTIQFSGNAGPTSLNTASWVTSKKWKGFYTVQDVDEFNTVSVHSSGAKDLNGNTEGTANGASFLIDTIAPSIDSITGNTAGTTGETTTIEAEFSNSYSQATIFYKPSGGSSWQSKSILTESADILIPSDTDKNWDYYVTVEDSSGNKDRSPSGTDYYQITVTDNDNPYLDEDYTSSSGLEGENHNFGINAFDNVAVDSVNVSWTHGTKNGNLALTDADNDGIWTGGITLDETSDDMQYIIQINDTSNNKYVSSPRIVFISQQDEQPPSITDNTPSNVYKGEQHFFKATLIDNIETTDVYVKYWYNGEDSQNESMNKIDSFNYNYDITIPENKNFLNYQLLAKDSSDNWNQTNENTLSIQKQETDTDQNPQAPTAKINTSTETKVESFIIVDGTESTDDGYITNYSWELGDSKTAKGRAIRHSYDKPGEYIINLTVTDNDGLTDTTSIIVTVTSEDSDKDKDSTKDSDEDGLKDFEEKNIGSDPENASDVKNISSKIAESGFLVDYNKDQKPDIYYDDSSDMNTTLGEKNNLYTIDVDGDGYWDYTYNATTSSVGKYEVEKTGFEIPWPYIVLAVIALVVIAILIIVDKKGLL